MHSQLTLASLLERAGKLFPRTEVVSHRPDNSAHRYTYGDLYRRARALAAALQAAGMRPGDRVATLMWNHYLHLEAYLGIPAIGGVLHTLNLRLHPDELAYIVNHAEDRFLIVDDVLLPLFDQIRDRVNLERVIVTRFGGTPGESGVDDYEQFLENGGGQPTYADVDETDAAAMCYTSGTTGKPKGVVYTHRTIALHSLAISLPDNFSIGRHDTVLPAMSMFHANAWGLPFASVMNGSALVLPGPNLQPECLLDLLSTYRVTLTGGVPTIWLGVIDELEKNPGRWPLQPGLRIIVAGSAAPETLFRRFDKLRRAGDSAVGHDRNRSHRDDLHAETAHGVLVRRGEVRASREAGFAGAVHGNPRRWRSRRSAMGRCDPGRARGAGTVGRRPAFTSSPRKPPGGQPMAGTAPATWRRSMPKAVSRLPIASRT